MEIGTLEEMAESVEDLYDRAVKLNLSTKDPELRTLSFEFRAELKWLKGKIEQLIAERRIPTPAPSTGREL